MYFLHTKLHQMTPGSSKKKGYEYKYLLPVYAHESSEIQQMQVMGHVQRFMQDTAMHKQPVVRFPQFTRRIMGVSCSTITILMISNIHMY